MVGETEAGAEGRVLFVDDDASTLEAGVAALAACGYSVESARNGALGLEAVLTFRPEVVVFDFFMPVSDGRELLAGLREVARTRIGLVAMSGAPEVEGWCERVGVPEFLKKPFESEQLRAAVGRAFDFARRTSERISFAPASTQRRLKVAKLALVAGRDDLVGAVRSGLREGDERVQVAAVPEYRDAVRALSSFAVDVVILCGGEGPDRDQLLAEATARGLAIAEGCDAAGLVRDARLALEKVRARAG